MDGIGMVPRIPLRMEMNVLIAPDSYKGSFTALEAAEYIKQGIKKISPRIFMKLLPLSDGGDGFLEVMTFNKNAATYQVEVMDPLARKITAEFAVLIKDRTAVIEMARASGLSLLRESEYDVLRATTYGTGQLIEAAIESGCSRIILGLGGSATCDGGAGALKALGIDLLSENGLPLEPGGINLAGLNRIKLNKKFERLKSVDIILAADVDNPLTGTRGAALTYAAQKGAGTKEIEKLEQGLVHYARKLKQITGREIGQIPGAGAAGGLGAGLTALLDTEIVSGIDLAMKSTGFREALAETDLVITGEGKLDLQSLSGKVVSGVCRECSRKKIPVVAICGKVESGEALKSGLGIREIYETGSEYDPARIQESIDSLTKTAQKIAGDIKRGKL